jgi:hypothetical protein
LNTEGTALGAVSGTSIDYKAAASGEFFFRVRAKAGAVLGPNMVCTGSQILKASTDIDGPVLWDPTANADKRATW